MGDYKVWRVLSLFLLVVIAARGDLSYDFYKTRCPQAEKIVMDVMVNATLSDRRIGASILRMHFHDCFVEGCDGSILIDSTSTNQAEKDFPANFPSIRGFDVIDAAKAAVEKVCPGIVSCADILAFAARDGVHLSHGPFWNIRSGRRDGRVSMFNRVPLFLPPPTSNITQLITSFAAKNLSKSDLVFLSGGHTIGFSLCSSFNSRLYNFTGRGDQDPALDAALAQTLKGQCPRPPTRVDPIVPMEKTPFKVDTKYFKGVLKRRGLFTSDSALLNDPFTKSLVIKSAADESFFLGNFIQSMIKMSELEVKTGSKGEIRKKCHVIN
ncbi:hypothetical protein SELMODRAFT_236655 [Selaginella moellendorffii]|uniref:Peroxidase n=1 Tax=Selaginella moellendorffii TaxID=88036 RepID=D8TBP8_SELML|nr:peroxidase 5 [Selaginella moellendorffii]EFJ05967.1 hypothetical protein SELMODRAFT_236655 [Selaginella moellendorffii]|eukprot:XP_002993021.1 peroxidase 5 [Selaginella moellendorffii]